MLAIIAGSKGDHPEKELEQFWLELADEDTTPFVDWLVKYPTPVPTCISQAKSTSSFYRSAFHGNEKVFVPRWSPGHFFSDPQYLTPGKWTYLFHHSPLINTIEKSILTSSATSETPKEFARTTEPKTVAMVKDVSDSGSFINV